MNRSKLTLTDSPIRVKLNRNRLPAQEPLPKKEEVKFKKKYMNAPKQEYCYAVLNAKTERLILTGGNLPIFWSRKGAKEYNNWTGTKIVRISLDQLHLFLNDSSAPIRPDEADKKPA